MISDLTLIIRNDYLQISTNYRQPLTLPIAYTLVLELCFYLVAPFIVKRKNKFIILLSLLALTIHFLIFFILKIKHEPIGDWFFPEVIIYFILGVLAYKIYKVIKNKKISLRKLYVLFLFVILVTIFYSFIPLTYHISNVFILKEWLYVTLIIISLPFIFKLTNKFRADRLIGELSYPVYLSHSLIIAIVLATVKLNENFTTIIIIVCTLIFSALLFYILEKPIEKFRQKRFNRN